VPLRLSLAAGEQVTVAKEQIAQPTRTNIAAATAWAERKLVFDASRLSDVVEEFNRYNTHQLVIQDAALEPMLISGVYGSTDPASLVRFLRAQPHIRVTETDADVRISSE
jgi:transmembrane sensor